MDTNELIKMKDALEHIKYEFWMLKGTYIILKDKKNERKNKLTSSTTTITAQLRIVDNSPPIDFQRNDDLIQHNALVESFTTHARCLLSFFYPEKRIKRKEDILINQFYKNENK